jgi:hypothetical protein
VVRRRLGLFLPTLRYTISDSLVPLGAYARRIE